MAVQRSTYCGVVRSIVFGTQPLWRSTLSTMLGRANIGPVTVCRSLSELASAVEDEPQPQLLVADADGPPQFVQHLRDVRERLPRLALIVVSERCDDDWRRVLADLGAAECIPKHCEVEEIEDALHRAIDARLQWSRLTARELEILRLVAGGCSNRDVATALWLSDQTVKFHLTNVYRKLGVASRAAAVAHAQREGLLPAIPLMSVDVPAAIDGQSNTEDDVALSPAAM